jgi:asparagine synthetase A
MGRPVLGLVETGTELEGFLIENNHMSVDKDDISKVKKAIESYVDKWDTEGLDDNQVASPFTVEATVNKLMSAVSEIDAVT